MYFSVVGGFRCNRFEHICVSYLWRCGGALDIWFFSLINDLHGPWQALKLLPLLPAENDLAIVVSICLKLLQDAIRKTPSRQYSL